MRPREIAIACVVVLASMMATSASAQPITKWTARVYNVGAAQPISGPVDMVLGAGVTCNVDPSTLAVAPTNPAKLAWNDVASPGKACVFVDPGNGILLSTPFGGSYEATLTASNAAGTSPESNRAPFQHPGAVPPAPTGLTAVK